MDIKSKLKKIARRNSFVYYMGYYFYKPLKKHRISRSLYQEALQTLRMIKEDPYAKIIYLGVPAHSNLGDQAQTYCTLLWCKKYFSNRKIYMFPSLPIVENKRGFLGELNTLLTTKDLILFQSGYCTADHHIDHKMHKIIVNKFKENKIIALPQTVNLLKPKQIRETALVFNSNPNLYFIARDPVSYEKAKALFPMTRIAVMPDIVTCLVGKKAYDCGTRNGILFCTREDEEQLISSSEVQKLMSQFKKYGRVLHWDTQVDLDYKEIQKNFRGILDDALRKISEFKLVITDRFHGTIFSLISGTPVIVLPTIDHKVTSGADWFQSDYGSYIYKLDRLDNLESLVEQILSNEPEAPMEDLFEARYYRPLAEQYADCPTEPVEWI